MVRAGASGPLGLLCGHCLLFKWLKIKLDDLLCKVDALLAILDVWSSKAKAFLNHKNDHSEAANAIDCVMQV